MGMGMNQENSVIIVVWPYEGLCCFYWWFKIIITISNLCRGFYLILFSSCIHLANFFLVEKPKLGFIWYQWYITCIFHSNSTWFILDHGWLLFEWILTHVHVYWLDLGFSFVFFVRLTSWYHTFIHEILVPLWKYWLF